MNDYDPNSNSEVVANVSSLIIINTKIANKDVKCIWLK